MKAILIGLLLWAAGAAHAESPQERYLATRDRLIQVINSDGGNSDAGSVSKDRQALRELDAMLQAMIGPVAVKGLPGDGRINLETLYQELGFGKLDGIAYGSPDTDLAVVVTTDGLLRAWLKGHKVWWPESPGMPQDIEAALQWDDFHTQAIGQGAAIARFAEIPVTASANTGFVSAMLVLARQDIGPWMPDEIIVSVVRDGRVFIASQPAAVTITPISPCLDLWRRAEKAARRARDAYRPTGSPADEALFAKASKLEEDGDVAHRRCFAEHVRDQSYFPAVIRQAQALVDRLS